MLRGDVTPQSAPVRTSPGRRTQLRKNSTLREQLRRAERMRRLVAVGLVAPLVLFILFTFAIPLAGIVWRAIDDRDVARVLPRTVVALAAWDGHQLPDETAYRSLISDLRAA